MDEDVDARERLFHSVVREYIVSMRFKSVNFSGIDRGHEDSVHVCVLA